MTKAILWDLGGVFATNSPRLFISEFSIKHELDVQDVVKAFKVTFGQWLEGKVSEEEHWKSMLNELNLPITEEDFVRECGELLRFFAVTNDDVMAIIKEIADANEKKKDEEKILQAIASNNPKELGAYLTEEYGLDETFDVITYSGDVGLAKPDKAFFEKVLSELGVKAEDALFIDDRKKNLTPAEELGMSTILFNDASQLKEEIQNYIEVK